MVEFQVIEVTDGDTFKVKGNWTMGNATGNLVRPTGYNTPEKEERGYKEAKQKLTQLILNKTVDVKNIQAIDKHGRLVADIYLEGKNLADYFPEYKKR